jgi:hypothetical protein
MALVARAEGCTTIQVHGFKWLIELRFAQCHWVKSPPKFSNWQVRRPGGDNSSVIP